MITYRQSTGWLLCLTLPDNGTFKGVLCYSGHPPHVNDPEAQSLHGIGPIPRGFWRITQWYDHPRLGKCVAELVPDREPDGWSHNSNSMGWTFGRSAFRIHGDSILNFGRRLASDGCIIANRKTREALRSAWPNECVVKVIW